MTNYLFSLIPSASNDPMPNKDEGTFWPTPRTEEGGADPSQYDGPGLSTAILKDAAYEVVPVIKSM